MVEEILGPGDQYHDSFTFLCAWESRWQILNSDQRVRFRMEPILEQILKFTRVQIDSALSKSPKLALILIALEESNLESTPIHTTYSYTFQDGNLKTPFDSAWTTNEDEEFVPEEERETGDENIDIWINYYKGINGPIENLT